MGWFVNDDRVAVEGLACRCPGEPHPDGDTVWLRSELTPEGGFAALAAMRAAGTDTNELERLIGRVYAEYGIVEWTFLDEDGEPVPCTREMIAALNWDAIYPIAEKGDNIYSEGILRPLVARVSRSSRNGHTAPSTSPKRRSSRKQPVP